MATTKRRPGQRSGPSIEERFWSKVDKSGPVHPKLGTRCWLWTGCLNNQGYGEFWTTGQHEYAHRVAYRLFVGAFPKTAHVLHRCDTPRCVCPDHLFLGTAADNMSDAVAKGRQRNQNMGKTHCIRGHAFTGHNLTIDRYGQRGCRECRNLRRRERRAEAKLARSIGEAA